MFDLHSHLLTCAGGGAPDWETSLAMTRAYVEDVVECAACTPHILPSLAERMLEEGIVHIPATDAHNLGPRPQDLWEGRQRAEQLVGPAEALHLVVTRPQGVLLNKSPGTLPHPAPGAAREELHGNDEPVQSPSRGSHGGLSQRMWRLFN